MYPNILHLSNGISKISISSSSPFKSFSYLPGDTWDLFQIASLNLVTLSSVHHIDIESPVILCLKFL